MKEITSSQEFYRLLENEKMVFAYFSHQSCSVCHVMKPKINAVLNNNFPKISQAHIDIEKLPDLAGQNSIFTAPVALLFIDGKENLRKIQNFGIGELLEQIERPYDMIFE